MKKALTFLLIGVLFSSASARADENEIEMLSDSLPAAEESEAAPVEAPPDEPAPAPVPMPTPVPETRPRRAYRDARPAPSIDDKGENVGWHHASLPPKHQHYWLLYFELGALGAVHKTGGGYVVAPWISWRPTIPIVKRVQLRANLFASILKNGGVTSDMFTAIAYEGFVAVAIDHGWLELGGGMQNWSGDNGGTHPVASVNIAAPFKRDYLGFIDRAVIGYSAFFNTTLVHEIKLGLGVAF